MKKYEMLRLFYKWLDEQYGNDHPHRQFMKMAWLEAFKQRIGVEKKLITDLLQTLTPTGSRMDGKTKWQTSLKSQEVIKRMFAYVE